MLFWWEAGLFALAKAARGHEVVAIERGACWLGGSFGLVLFAAPEKRGFRSLPFGKGGRKL